MAFVDLDSDRLVLRAVLAGPPGVGKSERLWQLGHADGARRVAEFGRTPLGPQRMATVELGAEDGAHRSAQLEVYEWRGPEQADARGHALARGLDGLIYLADARGDRLTDTVRHLERAVEVFGRSRLVRLPNLLGLGHLDTGLLRLSSIEPKLPELPWSHRVELPLDDAAGFVEAVRVLAEAMRLRQV